MQRFFLYMMFTVLAISSGLAGYFVYETRVSSNAQQKLFADKILALEQRVNELQQNRDPSSLASLKEVSTPQTTDQFSANEIEDLKNKIDTLEKQKFRQILVPEKSGGQAKESSREDLLTAAVAKVTQAVVSIVISKDVPQLEVVYSNPFGNDPFFKDFDIRVPTYRQKGTQKKKVGAGTGFLVKSNGTIFTNKHVVGDENAEYTVLLSNGVQKKASVMYKDTTTDLAIIKIEGDGYSHVELGDSGSLKLGQTAIAIGNALGEYNNSVSVGIISGLDRTIEASGGGRTEKLTGVIQTDAAINPGNSGGPLVGLDGKVIGVNVATVMGSNNISFSIPSAVAKRILAYFEKL